MIDPRLAGALHDLFGIPGEDLHPDAELEADLALDSLSIVELQVLLEERLDVRIRASDPEQVHTLGDLQRILDAALAEGEPLLPRLELADEATQAGA
jgi:acyl carrier protein